MITINLMPDDGSKKRARAVPAPGQPVSSGGGGGGAILVVLALIIAIGVNGAVGWKFWSEIKSEQDNVASLKRQKAKVQKEVDGQTDEAKAVKEAYETLKNQEQVLLSLDPPNRVLWSEKMNMLADLAPSNVFISSIKITEDIKMVETEASIKARSDWRAKPKGERGNSKEPKKKMRPLIRYKMEVEGLATGDNNIEQFNNMLAFQNAMSSYSTQSHSGEARRFMDGFEPNMEFLGFEATTYEEQPVHEFRYRMTTIDQNPPSADEDEE